MNPNRSLPQWRRLAVCALIFAPVAQAADYFDETKATTIFAFDTVSIPHTQNLRLEMREPERHPGNPVLRRGAPGTPDAQGVQFYGSIIKEGGKYRMWYVAFDDDKENKVASARWRPAYAESTDGLNWTKPNLGLVEFKGNKNNNLILTDPAPLGFVNLKVLKDDADPDPRRRYKATGHVYFRHHTRLGSLAPFTSMDGLHWKLVKEVNTKDAELLEKDLVLPAVHFEPSGGLYKWDGMFYASGQNSMNSTRPYHGRVTRMYRSADFVNWSQTSTIGFVRATQHELLGPGRSREGEQTHEGVSVWNRGNVLLGISGIWHGTKEWKDLTIDLGFMVSNDGLNFREPAHEGTWLKRSDDGQWDQGGLLQGQGFENIGEQTFVYYGAWDPRHWQDAPPRGGVGIALLPRDRFGELVVEEVGKGPGDYQLPEITSEFVTNSLELKNGAAPRFHLNADGLGPEAALRVELLDHLEKPIPGYSGADAAIVRQSGFQTPIAWSGKGSDNALPTRIKLRVVFEGPKRTTIRFSALYFTTDASAPTKLALAAVLHDEAALTGAHDIEIRDGVAYIAGKGFTTRALPRSGTYPYEKNKGGSLAIVDVKVPSAPKVRWSARDPLAYEDAETVLPLGGKRLLVGSRDLFLFDVTDSANPKQLAAIKDRPRVDIINGFARLGDVVFGANKVGWIIATDVSAPGKLELLGARNVSERDGLGNPHDAAFCRDLLVIVSPERFGVAGHPGKVGVYRVADPNTQQALPADQWTLIGRLEHPRLAGANRVMTRGSFAYVGSSLKPDPGRTDGLGQNVSVIDLTDPSEPRLRGSVDFPDLWGPNGLEVANGVIFAAGGQTVQAIDVSNPDAPRELARFTSAKVFPGGQDDAHDLVFREGHLFVTAQNSHALVVLRFHP